MTVLEPLVPGMLEREVRGMTWPEFQSYMKVKWLPGQHMALIAPTGGGKSNFVCNLLPLRKYVLAMDSKGGDETLAELLKYGFQNIHWPLKKKWWHRKHQVRKDIEEGKPARLIIGGTMQTQEEWPVIRTEIASALHDAFNERNWTVYVDELQITADRRLMNLGRNIEMLLIAARTRKVSLITSFQRPANVPRSASEMSIWFVVFYTRDRATVERLAEMAGRDYAEMRGFIRGLPEFCVLVFSRNPRDPVIVTKAPKL